MARSVKILNCLKYIWFKKINKEGQYDYYTITKLTKKEVYGLIYKHKQNKLDVFKYNIQYFLARKLQELLTTNKKNNHIIKHIRKEMTKFLLRQ